jgi:hypothetical protein
LLQALRNLVFELALGVTNSIDSVDDHTHNQATMERGLGALAAVVTWLAWFAISPALGFPTVGTGAMVNRAIFGAIPEAGHNPGFWMGWLIVIVALVGAIIVFFVLEKAHLVRASIGTGLIYGAALWLLAGVVVMPLLGLIDPSVPAFGRNDPMQGTLMMYSLGPLAALAALIAWLLFGAILGAAAHARQ